MCDQLSINDFGEVQDALWEAKTKWHNIGVQLKLKTSELDAIDADERNVGDKLSSVIKTRLNREPCTWRDLYNALRHPTVDMKAAAEKLAARLPSGGAQDVTNNQSDATYDTSQIKVTDIEMTRKRMHDLHEEYNDLHICAAEEMSNNVRIKKLRFSILSLPLDLKKKHKKFVTEAKKDIKMAESADEIMCVIADHFNYLQYPLLQHIIDRYGSDKLKQRMQDYIKSIESFRRDTRLEIFSEVCADEPEEIDEKFAKMVSKHQMDWSTATLEDVEKFRIQFCRELSLYEFSLSLMKVSRGCVEVTWRVPRSLVTYIQNSIMSGSQSMMEHHVTTLTIDGFIAYDSLFAQQNKLKVIRLQFQAIATHLSHLMKEVSPDKLLPLLVQHKLLTKIESEEVSKLCIEPMRMYKIINTIRFKEVVGRLPTFCAGLVCAGQPHIAETLYEKFRCLLKGTAYSCQQSQDDVFVSENWTVQLVSPPRINCVVVAAEIKASSLTEAQYDAVCGLVSSIVCLPTGILHYAGHTINPFTLHWYCPFILDVFRTRSLYTEMAQQGIRKINVSLLTSLAEAFLATLAGHDASEIIGGGDIIIPQLYEVGLLNAALDGDIEAIDFALEKGVPVDFMKYFGLSALVIASELGHVEVVDKLLQQGATVDLKDLDGWSPLILASKNGNVEVVDKLLQQGAMVDIQNQKGSTSLRLASEEGHFEVVENLLQHGAQVDLEDEKGINPLMIASFHGHLDVVEMLLKHGAKLDAHQKTDLTSLVAACFGGHTEIVDKLLKHGARVDHQTQNKFSSLIFASELGHVEVVRKLIEYGARVNLQAEDGSGSLIMASQNGHLEVVEKLLEHGAKVDLLNETGWSPLMAASQNGHVKIVEKLLDHGANANLQNEAGVSSLMLACYDGHPKIIDKLLLHGAIVDLKNKNDATALAYACKGEYLLIVSALLKAGADPNIYTKHGQTPLLLAVRQNNIKIVMELVRLRADVNQMEHEGLSALMMCCEQGNSEMAKVLLENKADPDLQHSTTGYTALMFASKRGHIDTVKTLLQHGANCRIKNKEDMTAANVASANNFPDVSNLIELSQPQPEAPLDDVTEHPDISQMKRVVEDVVKKFFTKMDEVPMILLHNSEKGISLNLSETSFRQLVS